MKYAIGLDCGITSVGFAVIELNLNDEPQRIIKLGSRIFDKAENPKDGSSLALPRREARGSRRRIRRHQHRLERIRYMLVKEGVLSQDALDNLFAGKLEDIYMLRCKALDEPLTNEQFARVLIHIAQRRGFKSNRKSDAADKEAGALLSAVSENQIIMENNNYRTVGEMLYKDSVYSECKRNKNEAYRNTVSRAMIEDEIKKIFEAQRGFNLSFASKSIENKYLDIVLSQRPFDLGPGKGSPYAGDQIEKMLGNCTLIEGEKRAFKSTYSFQLFTLWQNINNIRIVDGKSQTRGLTDSERKVVFDLCHSSPSVTYSKIRKELALSDDCAFNSLSYGNKDFEEVEKKTKFDYLKEYHQIRKALDKISKGYIKNLSIDELDDIGKIFCLFKADERIIKELQQSGFENTVIETLINNLGSFSKAGHISVKACRMLIPYLEQGLTYDKACAEAGLDFRKHNSTDKQTLLSLNAPELDDITNPVVRRAVSQTIKVINAVIREQGHSPAYINIELARDLSKNYSERNAIEKRNKDNQAVNEQIKKRIEELFGKANPTGMDIIKLKLYDEQGGIDPYSQKPIELARLFEVGYVDVDHIIPFSISFDDSFNNKVLTFSRENRQKGNKTPLQYLSGKAQEDFKVWVNSSVKNYTKRKNLLKEKADENDDFKTRDLNDTRYLSRVLFNYINDNLAFEDYKERNKHVRAVNGSVTAYLRKRWGIAKIRENGDLHHAVDAAVIACVTESLIQKVTKYSRYNELEYSDNPVESAVVDENGEIIDTFPFPYPNFRKELEIRTLDDPQRVLKQAPLSNYTPLDVAEVKPCFVSRMPRHKVTGAAHEATIRSGKNNGITISKTPLNKLKLNKCGEIEGYYEPESDRLLYNALLVRLKAFDGDAEKAFPQGFEFHKPKADGSEGPIVKKVKIEKASSLNVKARGETGVAENESMIRIDVFFVEGEGYYYVPIYVADTKKESLPDKAYTRSKKPEKMWEKMNDQDFLFSLFKNDLIKVQAKDNIKMNIKNKKSTLPKNNFTNNCFLYFTGADYYTASINVENHDGSYVLNGLGVKTLISIEKYTVDPIGNISKVNKEKRVGFNKE